MVMAGCGSKSTTATSSTTGASGSSSAATPTSGAALPQAAQLVQDCGKATAALHYVHVALATTNVDTLSVQSVNADVTNQPQGNGQAVGDASVRIKPASPFVAEQFLVTNKIMYTKQGDGRYTEVGPAEKIYDPGIILDKDKGLGNVVRKVQNPQVAGSETTNGVATVKVTGTIDAAVIDPVVPKLGEGGGTLPITLWITDVGAGTSPSASPSATPSAGTTPNLVKMLVNKGQGSVEITLSAWGKQFDVPNPTG